MNKDRKIWTKAEEKIALDPSLSNRQVMEKTGRSDSAVRSKRGGLIRNRKLKTYKQNVPTAVKHTTAVTDQARHDEDYWKSQYQSLHKQYEVALKANVAVDRFMKDLKTEQPKSYSAAPKFHGLSDIRLRGTTTTPESAVLLFSDTHIGKVTRPEQTLGFATYGFPTFLSRLKFMELSTISILREHSNSRLNKLVIAMLGDMLDGALNHGNEATQRTVIFNQFYAGAHAIAQFIRNIAAHVPLVEIETCVGNHTRFGTQRKMPTENRHSNFDMFMYAFLEALTKDIPNVKWNLSEQPFAVFQLEGFTFMGAHGDHWQGGDKAMGIPLHALARQINSTTQLFHKNGVAVPNYYLSGHLHRSIQLPHGMGDVTINGGFPGLDNYALSGNFNPVDPTQTLFKVHPKYGKTATYTLQLKHADVTKPSYDLPNKFLCE